LRKFIFIAKAGFCITLVIGFVTLLLLGSYQNPVAAQQANATTPTVSLKGTPSGAYITVTYIEPINVRSGPSSFDYPVVGQLPVGGTASAIGRSPANEWIEITFPDSPRGTAWVYAANVTLSPPGFLLPFIEPPPTPTPVVTPTLNQTFVAAFQTLPTSTRLPTFTNPPPLVFPTYTNPSHASAGRAVTAWVFVLLGLLGLVGLVITSIKRH
jgi:hypothetical protein